MTGNLSRRVSRFVFLRDVGDLIGAQERLRAGWWIQQGGREGDTPMCFRRSAQCSRMGQDNMALDRKGHFLLVHVGSQLGFQFTNERLVSCVTGFGNVTLQW